MILVLFRSLTHFIVGDGSPTLFSGYILAVELAEFDGLDGWCEKRGVKDETIKESDTGFLFLVVM